jgi:hypothetical protein
LETDEVGRLSWSRDFGWQWVDSQDISKLLGPPFGLDISIEDTDRFFTTRIEKQLVYWCSQRLNVVGREVIMNSVLISSLLYFLAIWGGSPSRMKRITAKV